MKLPSLKLSFKIEVKSITLKLLLGFEQMGVDIGDLFKKEVITIHDLQNRVVAIDAHNVLHQ